MSEQPHYGIIGDEMRKRENQRRIDSMEVQHQKLCDRCRGTGNEFYSMYRRCQECSGSGLVAEGVDE